MQKHIAMGKWNDDKFGGGGVSMVIRIKPFVGRLTSTTFHVRNPDLFETDVGANAIREGLDIMVGCMPVDDAPCYCLARHSPPREPFIVKRQPGEVVISEGGNRDPDHIDPDGWIATLQSHVREDDAIVITEYSNPDALSSELMWIITADGVRCAERALICQ
jgi:hypothetical protein